MNKQEKISIIITTYNRPNNIIEIIKLINKQLNFTNKLEIIICDSNSKGNLKILNTIKNYSSLDIKYFNLKKNHQAYKRNLGAKVSNGNFLIFLDDDCFPERNFLVNYYKKLKLKKKRIIYCGDVEYFQNSNIKNLIKFRNQRSIKYSIPNKKLSIKNFVTMNMGFDKTLFNKYENFFDKRFSYYGFEDFELAFRLKQKGFSMELIKAKIFHKDFRNFDLFLSKFFYMGKFGIKDIRRINIKAAKMSIFNKIYENKILNLFLKLPFAYLILSNIKSFIIFIEKKVNFYFPFLYKVGMFLSFVSGMGSKINKKKEFNSYNNSLKSWYE